MRKISLCPIIAAVLVSGAACSSKDTERPVVEGAGGSAAWTGGGGAAGQVAPTGSGGTTFVTNPGPTTTDSGRPLRCDEAGHCTCVNVASIGRPAHYGAGNDNTDAFQSWLNAKSSATVTLLTARTKLTGELLANYDVLILQALEDGEYGPFWQFDQSEIDAFSEYIKNGGGVIALTGYGADAGEVKPLNQLMQAAGITYNADDIFAQCPSNVSCYCWGNSIPMAGWQAQSPIAANVRYVGAFHGRSIVAPGASVVAAEGSTIYGVTTTVGLGRVFAFSDEWVTYTSQWLGNPNAPVNQYDSCYDAASGLMKTADHVFQVPQFWYNAIGWVANSDCGFTIDDPAIIK
jgi:hypothetical protein